jgi:magnesium chelatase family protein
MDRIDITRRVVSAGRAQRDPFGAESSADVRIRVAGARQRQAERFADRSWRLNGQIPAPRLKDTWPLPGAAQQLVDHECFKGRLSARGAVRVARLAWTIADLASVRLGRDVEPDTDEVGVALRLRAGDPLDLRVALAGQRP